MKVLLAIGYSIYFSLVTLTIAWANDERWILVWASGKYGSEAVGVAHHLSQHIFFERTECENFLVSEFLSENGWYIERAKFGNHLMARLKDPDEAFADFTVYTCDRFGDSVSSHNKLDVIEKL